MTFIITLVSLVIERFFHWGHLRNWRWFGFYQRWLNTHIANWPSYALLIICVLPAMIAVGVINCVLSHWLYGIPKLIFGIIVLLYCMGPNNLWVQLYSCLSELNKEDPSIGVEKVQTAFGISSLENSQAFHQAFTKAIFIEANQRIFAVLFWFVALGPLGAMMYRSIAMCSEQSDLGLMQTATQARRWLDWIPARVFTFLFALGGHFMEVFFIWKREVKTGVSGNDKLLGDCGIAALDVKENNHIPEDGEAEKGASELLDRAFVIWLVILAVFILIVK